MTDDERKLSEHMELHDGGPCLCETSVDDDRKRVAELRERVRIYDEEPDARDVTRPYVHVDNARAALRALDVAEAKLEGYAKMALLATQPGVQDVLEAQRIRIVAEAKRADEAERGAQRVAPWQRRVDVVERERDEARAALAIEEKRAAKASLVCHELRLELHEARRERDEANDRCSIAVISAELRGTKLAAAIFRAEEAERYTEQLKERIRVGNEIRDREVEAALSRAESAEQCLADRCENRMDGEDALEAAKVCAYVSALTAVAFNGPADWRTIYRALDAANIDEDLIRESGGTEGDIETVRRALREG